MTTEATSFEGKSVVSRMARGGTFLIMILSGTLIVGSTAIARTTTATLKGRVIDTDGAGLPSVVVQVSSKAQPSGNSKALTDIEGNYRIPLLPPASDYLISIDYPGFARIEVGPLNLDAGRFSVQDLTLLSAEESIDILKVTAIGSTVDTGDTSTATTYDKEFIDGLPIIGHNYQDVICLAPGVTDTNGDGNANVHGSRDTGIQHRLDGGNVTDPVDGGFVQNLNPALIEEIEVITTGASAEFGGTAGGFANIISRSGGNDFSGSFSIFWRGKFLDGDGADNNDQNGFDRGFVQFQDVRPTLTVSGPVVKDRLWYIASLERIDSERPVDTVDQSILQTISGNLGFGKLTWQVDGDHRLGIQITSDPLTFRGLGLGTGVSADSDFTRVQSTIVPQLKWTATLSPVLLLESTLTHVASRNPLTPVSEYFAPTKVTRVDTGNNILQAYYPCDVRNCNPALGEKRTFVNDLITNRRSGPFFIQSDLHSTRNAIKADLSYSVEGAGQHNLKSGIEFQDEEFSDLVTRNPILNDQTRGFRPTATGAGQPPAALDQVSGSQTLQVATPLTTPQQVSRFSSSAFLQNSWKPAPNLTINAGLRIDREDIDTSGFLPFDPGDERRAAISRWTAFCGEARAQGFATSPRSNCYDPATYDGIIPDVVTALQGFRDANGDGMNDIDPLVLGLDADQDGLIEPAGTTLGTDGSAFYQDFSRFSDRQTSNFSIVNTNFAPRLSISWDPWNDGKTRVFAGFNRFWDRLFLRTVSGEIGPDLIEFDFVPDPISHVINPGDTSVAASKVSVNQVDRNLKTPHLDEITVGFEREIAPEWTIGMTWIRKKERDLLQDIDVNHITCSQFQDSFGIDPMLICGDAGFLETDRFGDVGARRAFGTATEGGSFTFDPTAGGAKLPNGAPDLYTVNNSFNRVLRVGNFNSSDYTAFELRLLKRMHNNWQMNMSYTWSEAYGQAEGFTDAAGDDPETKDDEEGYLSFDQRHLLRMQAVARLPHDIQIGTTIEWRSNVPYSIIASVSDLDSTGNSSIRTFFPTGRRNDQRNAGQWKIDGRLEKRFQAGRVQASAFLTAENLLGTDDLTVLSYDVSAIDGTPLAAFRNLGRRFELGANFNF